MKFFRSHLPPLAAKRGILFHPAAFVGLMWLLIYLMLVLTDYGTRFREICSDRSA